MTKKSKWIAVVAIVLVFACLATLFVGCDKDKKPNKPNTPDTPTPSDEPDWETAFAQITAGLFKTTGDATLFGKLGTNLKMEVTTKDGDKTETYSVDFGLGLDLYNSYLNGAGNNKINLVVKEKTTGKVAFRVAYDNSVAGYEERMLVQAGDSKYAVKVPNVAKTIKEQFKQAGIGFGLVDDSYTLFQDKDDDGVPDKDAEGNDITYVSDDDVIKVFKTTIPGILPMVASFVGDNLKVSDTNVTFDLALNQKTVGVKLGSVLGAFNPYVTALGLNFDLATLGEKMPPIVITPSFNFKDGALTDINVSASIGKANLVIPHTSGTDFINLDVPRDLSLDIKAKLRMQDPSAVSVNISDIGNAKQINAINAQLKAELKVNKTISIDGIPVLGKLEIPADTYDIVLNASIDPTQLLGKVFTKKDENGKDVADLDAIITALLGEEVKDDNGATRIVGNTIDFLTLSLKGRKADKALIDIKLDPTHDKATVKAFDLLDIETPVGITSLVNTVKGLFNKPSTASTDAALAEEGKDGELDKKAMEIIKMLKPTLDNLTIKVSEAGGLDVKLAPTKYAIWIKNDALPNKGEFDMNKLFLSVAATAKLDANGLKITAQVKNGGSIIETDPNAKAFDIDVEITIKPDGFKYGVAEEPFPQA